MFDQIIGTYYYDFVLYYFTILLIINKLQTNEYFCTYLYT